MEDFTTKDPAKDMPNLHKLSDTRLELANPDEDIRRRRVLDSAGHEIGKVEDLIVDDHEAKVRFLALGSGGFLGIGEKRFFIPVDAITRVDKNTVYINETRERVASAPGFDPELATKSEPDWTSIYGYYGVAPFWGGTYLGSGSTGVIPTWIAPPVDDDLLMENDEEGADKDPLTHPPIAAMRRGASE